MSIMEKAMQKRNWKIFNQFYKYQIYSICTGLQLCIYLYKYIWFINLTINNYNSLRYVACRLHTLRYVTLRYITINNCFKAIKIHFYAILFRFVSSHFCFVDSSLTIEWIMFIFSLLFFVNCWLCFCLFTYFLNLSSVL